MAQTDTAHEAWRGDRVSIAVRPLTTLTITIPADSDVTQVDRGGLSYLLASPAVQVRCAALVEAGGT
jgi:hypothetical protein